MTAYAARNGYILNDIDGVFFKDLSRIYSTEYLRTLIPRPQPDDAERERAETALAKTRKRLEKAQDARRAALVERLGNIADLTTATPLEGELGDVAYDLLREAAAQIASDRQRLAALTGDAQEAGR